ncbi:glycoside hydrolase family 88 protein [Flavobacterium sp. 5]|uniref:glycoside hydrolase family 88 protein n=1 Tax=Flavobacterium sp. 5 TaxID=2035199 RepID=UPI000C2BA7D7|nr:glycoside hydrolase family 88 protein [Flavobacterium sp. 5]PKB17425.1 glycosyl hydrolase family 88 [Flavobacterium sp. 5]
MKKNKWIIGFLVISLICNLIVLKVDIIPFMMLRFEIKHSKNQPKISNIKSPEKIILNRSLEMANSNTIFTVFDEQSSFSESFLRMLGHGGRDDLFKRYNYPRAYLISGLTDYAKSEKDTVLMLKIAKIFDKYINDDGSPSFVLDKVDQVPFGIAAINLFKYTNNIKYEKFAKYIYNYIKSLEHNNIVLYRNNSNVQLNDVVGMICPFLVRYEEISKDRKSLLLCLKQLQFYNTYGVDKETFLPCHGINLKTNIKVGPTNWGRGIGWYLIGLSEYVKKEGRLTSQLNGLINSLEMLKTDDLVWTQFPGSDTKFDASSTTMFMYGINLSKPDAYSKQDVFKILNNYIKEDGTIISTSGDTHGINNYSQTFGESELSQGMLLMLLSTTTK